MTQLRDGRLMLHVWEWRFRRPEDGPANRVLHSNKVIRILRVFAEDNGQNWAAPQTVEPRGPFMTFEWGLRSLARA